MSAIGESQALSRGQRVKRTIVWAVKRTLTFLLSHVGLTSVVVGYVILGGVVFMAIEKPYELEQRRYANRDRAAAVEELVKLILSTRPPDPNASDLASGNDTSTNLTSASYPTSGEDFNTSWEIDNETFTEFTLFFWNGTEDLYEEEFDLEGEAAGWYDSEEDNADLYTDADDSFFPSNCSNRYNCADKSLNGSEVDDVAGFEPSLSPSIFTVDQTAQSEFEKHMKRLDELLALLQAHLNMSTTEAAVHPSASLAATTTPAPPSTSALPRANLTNEAERLVRDTQENKTDLSTQTPHERVTDSQASNTSQHIAKQKTQLKQTNQTDASNKAPNRNGDSEQQPDRKGNTPQQNQKRNTHPRQKRNTAERPNQTAPDQAQRPQRPSNQSTNGSSLHDQLLALGNDSTKELELQRVLEAVRRLENDTWKLTRLRSWDGQVEQDDEVQWSFAGAMLYSVTVVTTIGYGHLAPRTPLGRLVTIVYAIVGIPLTFLCIRNIGSLLSTIVTAIYRHAFVGLVMRWRLAKARMRRSRRISVIRDIMNDGARKLSSQLNRQWLAMDHRLLRDKDLRKSFRRVQKARRKIRFQRANIESPGSSAEDEREEEEEEEEREENGERKRGEEEEYSSDYVSSDDSQQGGGRRRVRWQDETDTRGSNGKGHTADNRFNEDRESRTRARASRHARARSWSQSDEEGSVAPDDDDDLAPRGRQHGRKLRKQNSDVSCRSVSGERSGGEREGKPGSRGKKSPKRKTPRKKDIKDVIRRSALLTDEDRLRRMLLSGSHTTRRNPRRAARGSGGSGSGGGGGGSSNVNLANTTLIVNDDDEEEDVYPAVTSTAEPPERSRRAGLAGITPAPGAGAAAVPTPARETRRTFRRSGTTSKDSAGLEPPTVGMAHHPLPPPPPPPTPTVDKGDPHRGHHDYDPLSKPIDTSSVHVPWWLTLLMVTGYILGGATMFSMWEDDWNFLEGSYFCFITLSTIGFGDFVPGTSLDSLAAQEKWIACCVYLLLGMALQAMCFHLMQEEVRASFRRLAARLRLMPAAAAEAEDGEEVVADTVMETLR